MPRLRRRPRTPPRERNRSLKLLLDENLSYRLASSLSSAFPGSRHVDSVGLHSKADARIWEFARRNGFTIVSKDDDFRQRSILYGQPPKVVWLSVGNSSTEAMLRILEDRTKELLP